MLRKGLSPTYADWLVNDYSYIVRKCGTPYPSVGDIEDVYDTMLAKNLSASRLSNFLKTVRHYCEFAGIERPDITAPRNFNQRVTYLNDYEAGRLLDACDSPSGTTPCSAPCCTGACAGRKWQKSSCATSIWVRGSLPCTAARPILRPTASSTRMPWRLLHSGSGAIPR